MDGPDESPVFKSEKYQRFIKRRARYAWGFALISFFSLVIFIGLATGAPDLFARRLFSFGFFTVGMAAGLCIFVICIALTGIYLHRCNVEFEPLQEEMVGQDDENQR